MHNLCANCDEKAFSTTAVLCEKHEMEVLGITREMLDDNVYVDPAAIRAKVDMLFRQFNNDMLADANTRQLWDEWEACEDTKWIDVFSNEED